MKKKLSFLCVVMTIVMLAVSYIPSGAAESSTLFISEVCFNPANLTGSDTYEYVEFVNVSDTPVNLQGGYITCVNDGGSTNTDALYTAGSGIVNQGEVAVIVIYQKSTAQEGYGYANSDEIDQLRKGFNTSYGSNVSADNFFVAARAVSGGSSNISGSFNLSNSAESVTLKIYPSTGDALCEANYNADKHNKNKCSVIFSISKTEGLRCMGLAATTPGVTYKELYTESTSEFSESMKIMTFNIAAGGSAGDTVEDDSLYIANRNQAVITSIKNQNADVLVLCELNKEWWSYIKPELCAENGKYGYSGRSMGSYETADNLSDDMWDIAPLILYDKVRYELLDEDYYVCPKVPDHGENGRVVNWAKLRDKTTGARFVVVSHHPTAHSDDIRAQSAELYASKIKEIAGDLPVILLGDFNNNESSVAYKVYVDSGLKDSARMWPDAELKHSGGGWTYDTDAGRFASGIYKSLPIDLIMLSEDDFTVNKYEVVEEYLDSGYALSDHFAVVVEAQMKKNAPEFEPFVLLDGSIHSIEGEYFFCGAEGLLSADLLRGAFDSPLYYATSVANEISCPGTGDIIYLKADPSQYLTIVMKGDVTGDGKIKTTDYSRIKNIMKGRFTPTEAQFLGADVNSDGKIGTTDYIRVKRHIANAFDLFG